MKATKLDASVFDQLASKSGENFISMYLPTHKRGREVAQDPIKLKNQIGEADATLEAQGWNSGQRSARLEKARDLLDDREFWEHQESGLGVFVDDDGEITAVATTRPIAESAYVMPVFVLRPLVADLHALSVPVLALTKNEVGLFTSSESDVQENTSELPSFDEVNWFVDREKERQQHPDQVGTDRSRHGHEPSAREDEDLARFLREVDAAIAGVAEDLPFIVLGDHDLTARFAQVSHRPTVSPSNGGIKAPFSSEEILERSGPMVARLERETIEREKSEASDQLGIGMATVDIREAIPAVLSGRVDKLLIDRTASPVWGRLKEATQDVEVHDGRRVGDVDLLDRLVVWGRENGAAIVPLEAPVDGKSFLARFRY